MDTQKLKDLLTQLDAVEINLNEARECISRSQSMARDLRADIKEIIISHLEYPPKL